MKNFRHLLVGICTSLLFTWSVVGQKSSKKNDDPKATEETENAIMFKFEPDFHLQNEQRKAEIARTRSIIDTLDVSERKRLRLLRDLYKNGISRRLQKAILVENSYEDIEE